MEKIIRNKLTDIEEKENITILHAIESGSRAWGFPSPDSDYDVRFIYIRSKEFYLKLEKTRDVVELPIDDILDINGWDIQKALRLLHSSNPTFFEWCNSPIIYKTTPFFEELRPLLGLYFQPKSGLYHYLSMAQNNYREHIRGDVVKAKKYFYVIRPILACRWILEHQSPPPLPFIELVESQMDESLKPIIRELLRRKMETPELGEIAGIDVLNYYIEDSLNSLKFEIQALPNQPKPGWEHLNRIFVNTLEATADTNFGCNPREKLI